MSNEFTGRTKLGQLAKDPAKLARFQRQQELKKRIMSGEVVTQPLPQFKTRAERPARPSRPARRQGDKPRQTNDTDLVGDYNIWYHKYPTRRENIGERKPAETRVDISRDSGFTKADDSKRYLPLCLFFARGCCWKGSQCVFHHRAPCLWDEQSMPQTHDCFGRERWNDHRDDMGGVGALNQENRTLYVGAIGQPQPEDNLGWDDIEARIKEEMEDFGPTEYCRVIKHLGIAFVRFRWRASAEFAKQAMAGQSLHGIRSCLNVRWAYDDPNPRAREQEEQRKRSLVAQALALKAARDGVKLDAEARRAAKKLIGPALHTIERKLMEQREDVMALSQTQLTQTAALVSLPPSLAVQQQQQQQLAIAAAPPGLSMPPGLKRRLPEPEQVQMNTAKIAEFSAPAGEEHEQQPVPEQSTSVAEEDEESQEPARKKARIAVPLVKKHAA
ncbi:MAG: hypothetical protein MHM6MM_001001 [Cercozoa sp. M6MM]